jgi:hypothetical protein
VNGAVPRIRYRHPRFSRDENDGVRTCHGPFIANRYGSATFFRDDHLFGIVMFVEGNHRPGVQNLCPHVKVFGVAILLVDLDDEFSNGTWTGRSSGAAQPVLAITLLENQGCGRRWPLRACRSRLRSLVALSMNKKYAKRSSREGKKDRQVAKGHESSGERGFEREYRALEFLYKLSFSEKASA